MLALDRKLLRDLLRLWGQILAIALIVACGIASFVSMQSAYESLKLSQATYYDQYRFAQVFGQLKRAPDSLIPQIQAISGVAQVQTRVVKEVTLDVPGRQEPVTGRLVSIPDQQSPMLNDLHLRQGRYITARRSDEVLVSEAFAKANHLQLGDRLGAVINGRWQSLQIVGIALSPEYIYEIRGGDIFPDNQRFGVLWIGRESLGTAFNMDGAFNDVALSLMPKTNPAEVIFRLDQLLNAYGGFGAYDRADQISNRFISDEILQLRGHAIILPGIFLGIGAFLLHILLSRLISTQRDQIAVLKAFGYRNRDVGKHFLQFVLTIVCLGAAIGIAAGLWLGSSLIKVYVQFFQFPVLQYKVSPGMVMLALFISVGAAVLGAVGAVQRAISLPPAEAMRPEPPAHFHATLMERLGLQRWLSPVGRIILRNLERKPIQAGLSLLGIALAVAILVTGGYAKDARDYLINTQYRIVQRDDVTIVFNEPRPARTRYEVDHLPGVLYAEPFRSVPTRLRFEYRTRKTAVMGLNPTSELHHLVDRHLNAINLPLDGILLSTKLAEILGVQPGQMLTVEVLEGDRPLLTVPVAGLVDELTGLTAYMNIHALNRLLGEGGSISGAFLAVDEHQLEQLYPFLKRTPAVTSVALRKDMIEKFQETIAKTQVIANTIQVTFACIIAFGVVYNAARIALSERSRELATLRIIGFNRAEIALVLLGEQAVLTIAAIPVGLLLGYGIAALLSSAYSTELYRFPFIVTKSSYAFAVIVIAIAALVSGLLVRRQCDRLDLIAVLKSRE
ncbi:MAG: ABC transporter permease [Oscillatoriophycideae cyanobacterium NC_groundwater_1537_Pr4_S-0.65um_50_18]|nr:ABC transporter permease [Oscillatoriophycideae cyanobacterium NC_groundwater_1537_Pr4_S-0.65um_50_18]